MTQHECQFNMYFIDNVIDLHNYKHPLITFINSKFISLKSDEYFKMNVFFKTLEFNWDNNWIFESTKNSYFINFDSEERYSIYKGIDRYIKKPDEFECLATIYLRAALTRNIIKRKYLKLTEFIADQTSIFSKILLVLAIVVMYLDYYFAYRSIIKKFFKISDSNNKKSKEIISEIRKYFKLKPKLVSLSEGSDNFETSSSFKDLKSSPRKSKKMDFNEKVINNKSMKLSKNNELRYTNKKSQEFVVLSKKSSNIQISQKKKKKNTNYISKIIISYLCPFVETDPKMDERLKAIQANFFLKMDIRSYMKASQLIDMISYLILNEERSSIMHFFCNPCISFGNTEILNNVECDMNSVFNVDKLKMRKYIEKFDDIVERNNKSNLDNKFIKLVTKELNAILKNNQLDNYYNN